MTKSCDPVVLEGIKRQTLKWTKKFNMRLECGKNNKKNKNKKKKKKKKIDNFWTKIGRNMTKMSKKI